MAREIDNGFRIAAADTLSEVGDPGFSIELVVNEGGKVAAFHNRPFRKKLLWLEFNPGENRLEFVLDDGGRRNFGTEIPLNLAKEINEARQILMVLTDEDAEEPVASGFFPLIVNGA